MGSNKILTGFQTFGEFPNRILEVNENSNCFFIKVDEKKYIVRQKFDYIEFDGNDKKITLQTKISYYDVINDEFIFKTTIFSDMQDILCEKIRGDSYIEIEPLYKYLGLRDDKTIYLNFEEVNEITKSDKVNKKVFFK